MLCGARSSSARAAWGRHDGARIAQALGFLHPTPCAATLHPLFRHVHRDAFEAHLGAWAAQGAGGLPPGPETPETALALEGHTLRGPKKPGAPGTHVFSALAHHVGVPLAQHAVDDTTHEITAVETLVPPLVLEGRMVTMDALRTQRHIAQSLVEKGGDEVMIVQANPPRLRADSALVFTLPRGRTPVRPRRVSASTT